jgi:DNA polymerase-1
MSTLSYNIIDTDSDFDSLVSLLSNQSRFCFDLETNSLETHGLDSKIVGIGFCFKEAEAYYVPFNGNLSKKNGIPYISSFLQPLFIDSSIAKIGHNIKFDSRFLNRHGVNVTNIYFDTMVASYCLYGDRFNHNLDDLTLHHLNHIKIRTKSIIPKKTKDNPNPTMLDVPIEKVAMYCCEDVDYTYRLFKVFKSYLEYPSNMHSKKIFYEIDMPLVPVLIDMECEGVKLSTAKLEELREKVSVDLDNLQKDINLLAKREVTLTKPADIAAVLFDELKLDMKRDITIDKTPTGLASTAADSLEKLQGEPIVDKILDYKLLTKIMSTYIIALPDYISKHTGMVHPFFGQTSTATGRFNCSNPNFQQIPARTEIGKQIREAFISRFNGGKILAVDYSQAELRILAHMADEKVFIKAYNNNEDVHIAVASEVVYDIPKEEVTKEQRTNCKTVNFGLLYGMRTKKLAKNLAISLEESTLIMTNYMGKMLGLKKFLDDTNIFLSKHGYTENYFGRRRYIPKIFSNDQLDQWSAQREGGNNTVQSTNADIIRIAMRRIFDMLKRNRYDTVLILQIHDELVFDVPLHEIDLVTPKIVDIMESVVQFKVKMKAEAKHADNWAAAH